MVPKSQQESLKSKQNDTQKSNLKLPKINNNLNQSNQNSYDNKSNKQDSIKNNHKNRTKPQLSVTNVNDIRHFLSEKNTLASATINLVKELRKEIDHEEIKKKLEKIPNRAPNVYTDEIPDFKQKKCKSDVNYKGNFNNISQIMSRAPRYSPAANTVNFIANLRSYNNSNKSQFHEQKENQVQKKQILKEKENDKNLENEQNKLNTKNNNNKNKSTQRLKFNGSQSTQTLEKNWYGYGKVDRKEFSAFNVSKSYNLQDSIGESSLFQDQGYVPSYLGYPKYSEKFKIPNSVTYKHLKNCKNSQLQFFCSLREY